MHRDALRRGFMMTAGPLAATIDSLRARAYEAAGGLWRRDPATWSTEAAVQRTIANRLGWLSSPQLMHEVSGSLVEWARSIADSGIDDVVLLGMGGSSLAPEVLRAVVGGAAGAPRFHMLDSTDPAAVRRVETSPARTLYILASKSGGTIEPNSLAAHFRSKLEHAGVAQWARHFVAITDEGTALATRARQESFRHVFINPTDIGGRYSALSYFGLVPAALMGQRIGELVGWGRAMLDEAQSSTTSPNPAVDLGLLLGAAAQQGRDKLTLIVPPALEPFGLWVEQLVAESTGKQGVGVIPIAGETFGAPSVYGSDRLFVRLRTTADDEVRRDRAMAALGPVPHATMTFSDPYAVGAEFVRWEVATAVAGALLGINPFDEPNVQQAKDATRVLLGRYAADGALPVPPHHATSHGARLTFTAPVRRELGGRPAESFLGLARPHDYLSILVYLAETPALRDVLHHFRMQVRDLAHVATMSGYGPRYLHSTGQLHKGGPNSGLFVLISADAHVDLPIPGEGFSFGTLELAQALGDFASLDATDRRGLHIHLPTQEAAPLSAVLDALTQVLKRPAHA